MSIFSLSSRRLQQRKKGGKKQTKKNRQPSLQSLVLIGSPDGFSCWQNGGWKMMKMARFWLHFSCSLQLARQTSRRRNGKLRFPLPVVVETDFSVICIGNECVWNLRIGIDWDGWREDAVRRLAGEMLEMNIWKVISKERLRLSSMGRDEKERAKARWRCKTQSKFSASNSPRRLIEILILGKVKISIPWFFSNSHRARTTHFQSQVEWRNLLESNNIKSQSSRLACEQTAAFDEWFVAVCPICNDSGENLAGDEFVGRSGKLNLSLIYYHQSGAAGNQS